MTEQNVTGRDAFIEAQALVYAIAQIQSLPVQRQEYSNMVDMCRIARAAFGPEDLAYLAHEVENRLGREVDLLPDYDPQNEDEEWSDSIVEYGGRYDTQIIDLRAMRARILAGDIPETPEARVIDFQSAKLRRQTGTAH